MAPEQQQQQGYTQVAQEDEDEEEGSSGISGAVHGQQQRALYENSPWWQRSLTHGWVSPILRTGQRKQLDMLDLPTCPRMALVSPMLSEFDERMAPHLQEQQRQPEERLPLLRILAEQMGCGRYLRMFLCVSCWHAINMANPMLLRELVNFVDDAPERPMWHGLAIAAAMFCLAASSGVFMAASININNTIGFKQQSILSAAIYRKALRLSPQQQHADERTIGELVNLMSNDAAKFELVAHFADDLLFPIYLGTCIGLLFFLLGVAVLPGILVMGASVLANTLVGKALMKLRRSQLANTDARVRLLSEAMAAIRVVSGIHFRYICTCVDVSLRAKPPGMTDDW